MHRLYICLGIISFIFVHQSDLNVFFITLGEVFKVYKKYPKINADGHCGENKLCRCFGDDNVTLLKHLLIYDMVNDPYEDHPLLENSSR